MDHVSIGHHQSQRPVPRGFPLFILIHFEIKNNYYNKLKNNVSRKFFKWFFLWYCSLIQ